MMYPNGIFPLLNVPALQSLLGTPVRVYPHGDAPPNVASPYVTYQLVSDVPENNLDAPASHDAERVQFNAWSLTVASLLAVVRALRVVLEVEGYVVSITDLGRDDETNRYGTAIDWERQETWPEA